MSLPLFPPEDEVSVWDTSSIVGLRQNNIEAAVRRRILNSLRARVRQRRLFFPEQVAAELGNYAGGRRVQDEFLQWARACQPEATSIEVPLERVRTVLERTPRLIDAEAEHEEADPYVVALALELRNQGSAVLVITDDVRHKPGRTSLADACGLFRIPSTSLVPYLRDEGLVP